MPWIRDVDNTPLVRAMPEPPLEPRERDPYDVAPLHYCEECGSEILLGEEYYDIEGRKVCADCVETLYLRRAGYDDD